LRLRSVLFELAATDRTAVVLFEPVGEAVAVKCVFAWQLATVLAVLAPFQADVAIRLLLSRLLRELCDELF